MDNEKEIREYVRQRDDALSGTLEDFRKWLHSTSRSHRNPRIEEISYHKLRTACVGLPMELRIKSKKWLLNHGYTPQDDGDIPDEIV